MLKATFIWVTLTLVCFAVATTHVAPKDPFMLQNYVSAVVTPFHPDGSLNLNAIDAQAASVPTRNVFICGTNGESMSLTIAERKAVAERWRAAATKYGLTLVVHVGTATPAEALELAMHAQSIGVDAIAAMAPFFFKPSNAADVVNVMSYIAKGAPTTPFYYYHIPSMTGVSVAVFDILSLAAQSGAIPTLRGAKFSDADLFDFGRCVGLKDMHGNAYNMLFGKDEFILSAFVLGADGGVGSTYQLPFMTPIYLNLLESASVGNITAAAAAQSRSRDLVELMHIYGSGALKGMLLLAGFDAGPLRLPQSTLSGTQLASLHSDLVKQGYLAK